ncbi:MULTISPECIES: nuclear transport factor 2 family protein [unclassified Pedobacter]|uniref:nuclear transport factor 2 family protein n=1 Tax=unclassified Pedobacter TaxID=2628915 RepID=UPI0020350BC6|nr:MULTISPECIES: nuclear transport factor 2 family protein [unclassified Pedobacter]
MKTQSEKKLNYIYRIFLISIILGVLFNISRVMAQTNIETTKANKEAIRLGFAGWTAGTGNFFDLLHDDMVWTITGSTPYSKTYKNKKQFIDEVINPLNRRFSKKIVPTVRAIYGDGDVVIAYWDGVATAKDGKGYKSSYAWFMQMKEGKIINVTAFLDGLEFGDIMKRLPGDE